MRSLPASWLWMPCNHLLQAPVALTSCDWLWGKNECLISSTAFVKFYLFSNGRRNRDSGPLWRSLVTSSALCYWSYSLSLVALTPEAKAQFFRASPWEICKMMTCSITSELKSWGYSIWVLTLKRIFDQDLRMDWSYVFTKYFKGAFVPRDFQDLLKSRGG